MKNIHTAILLTVSLIGAGFWAVVTLKIMIDSWKECIDFKKCYLNPYATEEGQRACITNAVYWSIFTLAGLVAFGWLVKDVYNAMWPWIISHGRSK